MNDMYAIEPFRPAKKTRNSNQGNKFSGIICEKRVIENRIGFGEIASKLPND